MKVIEFKKLAAVLLALAFFGGMLAQSAPEAFAFSNQNVTMMDCHQKTSDPCHCKIGDCVKDSGCLVSPAAIPALTLSHLAPTWVPVRFYVASVMGAGLSVKPDHMPPIS